MQNDGMQKNQNKRQNKTKQNKKTLNNYLINSLTGLCELVLTFC